MPEKIVAGPEQLILDKETYPITFATMTAIEQYKKDIEKAQKEHTKAIGDADLKYQKAEKDALEKVKGSLK